MAGRERIATPEPTCGELVRRFRACTRPTEAELGVRRVMLTGRGEIGGVEALERARRRAGLTQEELVARCGLSVEGLRKIERDRASPQPDTIRILARALDLSAADARLLRQAAERGRVARTHTHNQENRPGELPALLSRFVGRTTMVAALTSLLVPEHGQRPLDSDGALAAPQRLLVLTGIGGSGKTRLALEVAATARGHFPQAVRLVDLAAIPRGAGVAAIELAVAGSLGLQGPASRLSLAALIAALQGRILLLLDNCEHLIEACRTLVVALLRACPALQILATSREALGIAGEYVWPLLPMALPPEDETDPVSLAGYEAVALFADRATARVPGFTLDTHAAPLVAHICARLDGLPLAIELAAARLPALSLIDLAVRLDDRFALLNRGNGAAAPRQQTLRATMDWSYDLLSGEAARLLGRLSVFAGGWTLAAAERVCSGEGLPRGAILEALTELVDRSLVQTGSLSMATGRYGLLETVRQYARLRLEEGAPAAAQRSARILHLRWCGGLAAWPESTVPKGRTLARWAAELALELDNLRAALLFGEAAAPAEGLELAVSLWPFWLHASLLREGRRWLEHLLAAQEVGGEHTATTRTRAAALHGTGRIAERQGAYAQADDLYRRSLATGSSTDDQGKADGSQPGLTRAASDSSDSDAGQYAPPPPPP